MVAQKALQDLAPTHISMFSLPQPFSLIHLYMVAKIALG